MGPYRPVPCEVLRCHLVMLAIVGLHLALEYYEIVL